MSKDADRLREAFESRQLDRLIAIMDPHVTWRGLQQPGEHAPLCHDRDEVQEVMERAIQRGLDGRPLIIGKAGDSVVVAPRASRPRDVDLHQVFTFRGGRVVLMQDYPDRASAMAAINPSSAV